MLIQVAPRAWPADAVHDTVAAVLRAGDFRRSLQTTLLERLVRWIGEWIDRFLHAIGGVGTARTIALALAALLVVAVVARLALAARARDPEAGATTRARRDRGENPWHAAARLRGEGRYEDAAHALYRAVLTSLSRFDEVVYGHEGCGPTTLDELDRLASPFAPGARAA